MRRPKMEAAENKKTRESLPEGRKASCIKNRDSNLELYRIITMLLIVAHHYVANSGLISDGVILQAPLSWRSIFLLLFGAWGKTGINCFVLITGYFLCQSNISLRKFVKLLFEVLFYRIVIYLAFVLTGYISFSISSFATLFIPIQEIDHNFTGCFLAFYLCIPFLNIFIHHLTEKQHLFLLCLSEFIYILLGTVHRVTINYVSWFIVLYFISSYIRLYPKPCFKSTKLWGWMTLFALVVASISVVACAWLGDRINHDLTYYFVSDSNTFLAVFLGVSSFLFFKNIKIPYHKLINTLAASTFGVLCIHANSDAMRNWLWRDFLNTTGFYHSPYLVLHAVGSVVGIFAACTFIDMIRIRLIETPFFTVWDERWPKTEAWYKKLEHKFLNKMGISNQ